MAARVEQYGERHWPSSHLMAGSVVGSIIVISLLHYLTSMTLMPYHAFYRSLYYVPLALAAIQWGVRGGVFVACVISMVHLPYILFYGHHNVSMIDGMLEIGLWLFVGTLAGALADQERRQRRQAQALQGYIDDVLRSLPVGVATVNAAGSMTPQNEVAARLLPVAFQAGGAWDTGERIIDGRSIAIRRGALRGTPDQVLVLEDVTVQRHMQSQARQAERLQALERLTASLAHEIRNPLSIVRATAQLLAQRLADHAEVGRYLMVLTTESDRIERLIGELVEYAQPRPRVREAVDVGAVVEAAVHALHAVANQQAVAIEVQTTELPTLEADREHLHQALVNLLLNALQASSPGATVRVEVANVATDIVVTVCDQGPGVPPELQALIFEPFFTTRNGGMGLGLAHIARIAEDHGGTIRVENQTECGACFVLRLPTGAAQDG